MKSTAQHRLIRAAALTLIVVLCMAALAACSGRYMKVTVSTDSMEPLFSHGDVVEIDTQFDVNELHADDIIAYHREGSEDIVLHRITGVLKNEETGERSFQVKADANDDPYPDLLTEKDIVGVFTRVVSN